MAAGLVDMSHKTIFIVSLLVLFSVISIPYLFVPNARISYASGPSIVQECSNFTGSGSAFREYCIFSSPVTMGDLIVISFGATASGGLACPSSTPSHVVNDTLSLVWSYADECIESHGSISFLMTAPITVSGAEEVELNYQTAGEGPSGIVLYETSGVTTTGDQVCNLGGINTNALCPLSALNGLVFCALGAYAGDTITSDNCGTVDLTEFGDFAMASGTGSGGVQNVGFDSTNSFSSGWALSALALPQTGCTFSTITNSQTGTISTSSVSTISGTTTSLDGTSDSTTTTTSSGVVTSTDGSASASSTSTTSGVTTSTDSSSSDSSTSTITGVVTSTDSSSVGGGTTTTTVWVNSTTTLDTITSETTTVYANSTTILDTITDETTTVYVNSTTFSGTLTYQTITEILNSTTTLDTIWIGTGVSFTTTTFGIGCSTTSVTGTSTLTSTVTDSTSTTTTTTVTSTSIVGCPDCFVAGFPNYLVIFIFMILVVVMLAILYRWMRKYGNYGKGIET